MTLSASQLDRARFIRAVLAWHDVTQTELAAVLGCTQQSASRKLAGKARFTDDDLAAVVDAYGIDADLVLRPGRAAELLGVRRSGPGLLTSTFRQLPRSRPHGPTSRRSPRCERKATVAEFTVARAAA